MMTPWYKNARILRSLSDERADVAALLDAPARARAAEVGTNFRTLIARELGRGYDSFRQEIRHDALDPRPEDDVCFEELAPVARYEARLITSGSELRAFMEADASASCSTWGRDLDPRGVLASAQGVTSHHAYLAVRCRVVIGAGSVRRATLREEIVARLKDRSLKLKAFYRMYGDRFIESASAGGELVVLYEFATGTEVERQRVWAALRGACDALEARGDLVAALASIHTSAPVTARIFRRGGPDSLRKLTPESLVDALCRFPELVDPARGGVPDIVRRTTRAYGAAGFPGSRELPFERSLDLRRDLLAQLDAVTDLMRDIEHIQGDPRGFGLEGERLLGGLSGAEGVIKQVYAEIRGRLLAIHDDPDLEHRFPTASFRWHRGETLSAERLVDAVRHLLPNRGAQLTRAAAVAVPRRAARALAAAAPPTIYRRAALG